MLIYYFYNIYDSLSCRMNLYELKENRIMKPKTFSAMLSNVLYEKRFGPYFIEPVIAGLDPYDNKPYVCNMDLVSFIHINVNTYDKILHSVL